MLSSEKKIILTKLVNIKTRHVLTSINYKNLKPLKPKQIKSTYQLFITNNNH